MGVISRGTEVLVVVIRNHENSTTKSMLLPTSGFDYALNLKKPVILKIDFQHIKK